MLRQGWKYCRDREELRFVGESPAGPFFDPATSPTSFPPHFSHCNMAKYDLPHSRRRMPNYSGPVPMFLGIMTSGSRGVREKRYNRAFCGLRCTSFPTGEFEGKKIHSSDDGSPPGFRSRYRQFGAFSCCTGSRKSRQKKNSLRPVTIESGAGDLLDRKQSFGKISVNYSQIIRYKKNLKHFPAGSRKAPVLSTTISPRGRSRSTSLASPGGNTRCRAGTGARARP